MSRPSSHRDDTGRTSQGYQNSARTISFVRLIVHSVAAIATRLVTVVPQDDMKLVDEVMEEGQHIDRFISMYPIDLYNSSSNAFAGTLEYLVNEFKSTMATKADIAQFPEGCMGDRVALFTTLLEDDDSRDANQPR